MFASLRHLDDLLRGKKTTQLDLAAGQIDLPLARFVPLAIVLGAVYGFFMGWYGVLGRETPEYMHLLASAVKLPALFLLTLAVTFPSLYVFSTLVGGRLSFTATLRLLVGAITVNVTIAASLATILGFFTLSTQSYAFMILLNVALLAVAGFVALGFLLSILRRLAVATLAQPYGPATEAPAEKPAGRTTGEAAVPDAGQALGRARFIFQIWLLI